MKNNLLTFKKGKKVINVDVKWTPSKMLLWFGISFLVAAFTLMVIGTTMWYWWMLLLTMPATLITGTLMIILYTKSRNFSIDLERKGFKQSLKYIEGQKVSPYASKRRESLTTVEEMTLKALKEEATSYGKEIKGLKKEDLHKLVTVSRKSINIKNV